MSNIPKAEFVHDLPAVVVAEGAHLRACRETLVRRLVGPVEVVE